MSHERVDVCSGQVSAVLHALPPIAQGSHCSSTQTPGGMQKLVWVMTILVSVGDRLVLCCSCPTSQSSSEPHEQYSNTWQHATAMHTPTAGYVYGLTGHYGSAAAALVPGHNGRGLCLIKNR